MAAIELGTPYYIYNNALTQYFALNVPADPKFVGFVDDITGLDSPGVRENAQVINGGDGGIHGSFWKDRRPWSISGVIMPQFPVSSRDAAQETIEGIAMQCLRKDGYMTWTPADGIQRLLPFRCQQPPRMSTGQAKAVKNFAIAMVTADFRVISNTVLSQSVTGLFPQSVTCQNLGNAAAAPIIKVTGPWTSPVTITNTTTGKKITFNASMASATYVTIDLSGSYPTVISNAGADMYGSIDPLNTDWSIAVEPALVVTSGNNTFQVTGTGSSAASALQVQWRHSWV